MFLNINLYQVAMSLFGESARKKKVVALLILINIRNVLRIINYDRSSIASYRSIFVLFQIIIPGTLSL